MPRCSSLTSNKKGSYCVGREEGNHLSSSSKKVKYDDITLYMIRLSSGNNSCIPNSASFKMQKQRRHILTWVLLLNKDVCFFLALTLPPVKGPTFGPFCLFPKSALLVFWYWREKVQYHSFIWKRSFLDSSPYHKPIRFNTQFMY